MVIEQDIKSLIEKLGTDRSKTFAEFIAELFKDKFIEIYLGDAYETISTEQVSSAYPAVFCGKVVGAFKECLVLNSIYVDKSKKAKLGNILFINERALRGLTEVDENGSIEEMFLRSRECATIKAMAK